MRISLDRYFMEIATVVGQKGTGFEFGRLAVGRQPQGHMCSVTTKNPDRGIETKENKLSLLGIMGLLVVCLTVKPVFEILSRLAKIWNFVEEHMLSKMQLTLPLGSVSLSKGLLSILLIFLVVGVESLLLTPG